MTSKFKVGDEVMISTSSMYYIFSTTNNPRDIKGKVTRIREEDGRLPYFVEWSNGGENGYEASGLILVEEVKEKHIHDILVDKSTLEVGDIVMVTHRVPSNDLGWSNYWLSGMDRAIGKECVVTSAPDSKGITLGGLGEGYSYPLQSVQFVRKASKKINVHISEDYIAVVTEEGIKINNQVVTFEDFDDLAKAVAKIRK
jgi:hypothetical protein